MFFDKKMMDKSLSNELTMSSEELIGDDLEYVRVGRHIFALAVNMLGEPVFRLYISNGFEPGQRYEFSLQAIMRLTLAMNQALDIVQENSGEKMATEIAKKKEEIIKALSTNKEAHVKNYLEALNLARLFREGN